MKYLFFSMLFLAFLFSCKKEEPIPPQPPVVTDPPIIELGKSYFLMNGVEWPQLLKADYFGEMNGQKMIRIYGKRTIPNSSFSESISIGDVLPEKGTYSYSCYCDSLPFVKDGIPEILMGWVVDGDQVLTPRHIDTTQMGSFIEIMRYDAINHTVEGRFEAYLKNRDLDSPHPLTPLEIHLTEGKFNLKIEQ